MATKKNFNFTSSYYSAIDREYERSCYEATNDFAGDLRKVADAWIESPAGSHNGWQLKKFEKAKTIDDL